jgi:transposase
MDRAYEGDRTRAKGVELGYMPVVPPKANRKAPWTYNKELYRKRNEIERFFSEAQALSESVYPLRQT